VVSTGLLAGFARVSDFSIFRQVGESLGLLGVVFGDGLPRGVFWQRRKIRVFATVHGFWMVADSGS